jgi:CBS domain-containing protein
VSNAEDVVAYLGDHAPFQSMAPDALAELASASTTHHFDAGELITDYTMQVPDDVWMLRAGHVVLFAGAAEGDETLDTVEPGGIFGVYALLTGGKVQFAARATEPSTLLRLPGALVRSVFANPEGLSYIASSAWDRISGRSVAQRTSRAAVADLVRAEPVLTAAETPIRDAVKLMAERHSSYVLIPLPGGDFGIFTDRDLRTRVVAAGMGLNTPVAHAMSAPAHTVTGDRAGATVLMEMLEFGLRHMPVVDHGGRVLGVVEETDLVASSTRQSFLLRRAIAFATNTAELQVAARRITDLGVDLFRGGTDAAGTSAVISVVIDAVVRRALELEIADQTGAWRHQFAWLTMGSIARREAMPSSDVDSALSWSDEMCSDKGRFLRIAAGVHTTLDHCGLPADTNGAVAYKARFARCASEWSTAAQGWLDNPMKDRGLVMSSLLLDARVVWGDPALHTAPAAFSRMPVNHPHALRLQLLDALAGKVRPRSLRDVVARRGGTFDLKAHALTPIVNLARWAGLTVGLVSASTPARLAAGAGNGILSEDDANILREVFDLLQRLRMAHQIEQLATGCTPGDIITMSELSPLNRSLLNDGVREIAAVQRRVRQTLSNTVSRSSAG